MTRAARDRSEPPLRVAFRLLITATLLGGLWLLLLSLALPFGAADFLYGSYRQELREAIGMERANHFTSLPASHAAFTARQTAPLIGLPLLALNAGWVAFALHALNKALANRGPGKPVLGDLD